MARKIFWCAGLTVSLDGQSACFERGLIMQVDIQKLKYDLAMQSAVSATILNRREDETVAAQMAREFGLAYQEYNEMNQAVMLSVATGITKSEQFGFEAHNSLGKRKV